MSGEREGRRPQLVRGIGNELAACMLEPGEAEAHAVEGAGELAELVRARVLDRLVERPAGDPLGRLLEAMDAPGKEPGPAIAQPERGAERDQRRDQETALDHCDAG